MGSQLRVGTCGWKYPSWKGLVYSPATGIDYLSEYDLARLLDMMRDMRDRGMTIYLNINNHFEGSAPLTIERLRERGLFD